ncbi:MAG: hypothetical protein WDO73_24975 [Ignavibacteriota bacterium]
MGSAAGKPALHGHPAGFAVERHDAPGTAYAAVLVDTRYVAPKKLADLPERGGSVLAVATTGPSATPASHPRTKEIQFSGYPWKVREAGRAQSGQVNFYDSANASVDQNGFLHLHLTHRDDQWVCAEVTLARSLGYGSYRMVVRDISRMERAAVLIVGPSAKIAIELSRWGRPKIRTRNTSSPRTPSRRIPCASRRPPER